MSENQDGTKINQSLTDMLSGFCEISNKTITHLPLEFSKGSGLCGGIYLIRSEFSDNSVMYFPELQITFKGMELFESALIPYSLRERYFTYNGPLKDMDNDKEAQCQFLLECLKSKEIIKEMMEMLEFGMSRFFDPNEIGEFLESQQNKFIGLCDLDLEIAGYGKKIQFFINLGDGYEICYEAYEIPEDEFYESRLFVNPVFLDAKAGKTYSMHEHFPPWAIDLICGYDRFNPMTPQKEIRKRLLRNETCLGREKRIRSLIEWYEIFLKV